MAKRQPAPKPFSVEELEELAASPALQGFDTSLRAIEALAPHPWLVDERTVVDEPATTVVDGETTTVVDGPTTTVIGGPATTVLWQSENGLLFPASRARRVDLAQHALTHPEESVYNCLWGVKSQGPEEYRLVRMGYDRISKAARITKRNAALIVERLAEKGFLRVEAPADILNRTPTQYRVYGYRAVLAELERKGRRWVVRSGNGVLFVRRVEIPTTTVVADKETTVVDGQPTTVVAPTTVTVVAGQSTTVVAATTPLGSKNLGSSRHPSSEMRATVGEVIRRELSIDDDGVARLVAGCLSVDPNATIEEIVYFTKMKMSQHRSMRNLQNPIGLLIASVPKCFDGSLIAEYRRWSR